MSFVAEPNIMGCDTQVKDLHGSALDFQNQLFDVTFTHPLFYEGVIDYVELKQKARFTDILWDYTLQGRGLFVSEKTKLLLSSYKLLNANFYPAIVRKAREQKPYFCLRMSGDISDKVDYSRSEFLWYKADEEKDYLLRFSSAQEMIIKEKEVGPIDSIRAKALYFNDDFVHERYDMIFLGLLGVGKYYINDRLKLQIERDELVGLDFKEAPHLLNGDN
jgi:hypothetical protein